MEAENGSSEHQIKIASHYLRLAEVGTERDKNGEQAVYWFIKASQRGDETATEKLRHCVTTNLGKRPVNGTLMPVQLTFVVDRSCILFWVD